MALKGEQIRHPSFGMISFCRCSVSNFSENRELDKTSLFGSSIPHRHMIKMEIHSAMLQRDLYRDLIFPEKTLIEIEMSTTQFADAITSLNTSGVPCTITFFNGKTIEGKPIANKRMQFDNEFENLAKKVTSDNNEYYKKVTEILSKNHISKGDRKEILQQLDFIKMQIESNIPFLKQSFTEQMDKTVLEAKNEFSAFVDDKIQRVGLKNFKKELLQLQDFSAGDENKNT